jgi:hypothetical protein
MGLKPIAILPFVILSVAKNLLNATDGMVYKILRYTQDDNIYLCASYFTNPTGVAATFKLGSKKYFYNFFSLIQRHKV